MAVMKIKNENGEWVSGAPVNFLHQFKMVQVPRTEDGKGWDLSPYIQKNSDFILFFVFGASSATTGVSYCYVRGYDDILAVDDTAKLFGQIPYDGWYPLVQMLNPDNIPTNITMSYDEDTRILKALNNETSSNKISAACLIYAG